MFSVVIGFAVLSGSARAAGPAARASSPYAGVYFGTGPDNLSWALSVRSDGRAKSLIYDPIGALGMVADLTVDGAGRFSVSGTVATGLTGANVPSIYAGEPFTLAGQIAGDSSVTATLLATGVRGSSLTAARDPPGGAAQGLAGSYTATGSAPADGMFYAVVGPSGAAMALVIGPSELVGANGPLDGTRFSVQAGLLLAFTLAPDNDGMAASTFNPPGPSASFWGSKDGSTLAARLVGFTLRSPVGPGNQLEILGFVVGGAGTPGTMPALLRAVGTDLWDFDSPTYVTDPVISLMQAGTVIDQSAGWDTANNLIAAAVGAIVYTPDPPPQAGFYEPGMLPGTYTAAVFGQSGDAGTALAQIYDASPDPGASAPRLINVSGRAEVGGPNEAAAAQFIIAGQGTKQLLIRAIGPSLAAFGVTGPLPAPELELDRYVLSVRYPLATRGPWGGDPELAAAFAAAGAFPLAPGSGDAALLVSLPAGSYLITVGANSPDSGIVLIEIYEVP